MRSSFHYDPKQQEKIGKKKGKPVTSPLTTGAGTIFCMQLFSLKYYTVLQNIAVVQRGCLSFFCPDHKKKEQKKGKQKKNKKKGKRENVP